MGWYSVGCSAAHLVDRWAEMLVSKMAVKLAGWLVDLMVELLAVLMVLQMVEQ